MASPTPNPASSDTRGWTTLPVSGREGRAPRLVGDYSDRAKKAWREWWASPMAVMWNKEDVFELERLLFLFDLIWNPGIDDDGKPATISTSVHSEARQLADRFGFSPKSRQALRWIIEGQRIGALKESSPGMSEHGDIPKAGGSNDPRLRMIEGGKAG